MAAPYLSPYRLGKARETFNVFNVFNSLSWGMIGGSIITLFVIRLGASSTYIGALSALLYVSLFFLPLGRLLARRFRVTNIMGTAWVLRSLGMIPVVFAPLAVRLGNEDAALVLTMIGVAIFHVTRGIGMVGNTPILSSLASGPDRGSYMTQVQIVNSATGMVAGFAIAIVLGREPPLVLYSIIMTAGIVCGVTSGLMLRKVPEPPSGTAEGRMRLGVVFREALSQPAIRLFLAIFMLVALASGVSRTFLVVYAREVFGQDDGMVLLFSVFGGLGHLLVGMLVKFFVDRIGAKPLFVICVMTGLVTMLPIVFFPRAGVHNATMAILFLAFLFFMLNFGFLGSEGIAQTYFLGLVPQEKMLDMGILYFLLFGVAGAVGSFLAGLLLDALALIGLSPFASFKVLFSVVIALTALAVFMQRKLTPLGALPLSGAVRVMFSFRDLHAITLLDRLDRSHDFDEQKQLLDALHKTPSQLSIRGILEQAKSPRLATRIEAIRALDRLERLDESAEKILLNDVIGNPFTTAYISARILGNHGYAPAIPILRELASSSDYMLAGESMIALARLRDAAFRPELETLIRATDNPRLKIMGVESLGIYGSPDSLGVLIDILKEAAPPPYLRDEVVLAMAQIAGIQNQFARALVRFMADPSLAPALAADAAETAVEFFRSRAGKPKPGGIAATHAEALVPAVSALMQDDDPEPLSRWLRALPDSVFAGNPRFAAVREVLSQELPNPEFSSLAHLRLLAVHWAAHKVRLWAKRSRGAAG